ncbi:MAG: hypothetical protein KF847_08140 [Pirellulales bacterium]|nr:hypothetical protein [Pirellulales bacterium]
MAASPEPVDPNRLSPAQAAKLLSAAAGVRIPITQIEADVAAGAPTDAAGNLNLVHYAAWLAREVGRGE